MRMTLWRRCFRWLCLAVATRAAASEVVAGVRAKVEGQGHCEVLNFSETSPMYLLPTCITVRPTMSEWRLEVVLIRQKETTMCVRLEDKQDRLRLAVLMESCDNGIVKDYNYVKGPIPSGALTNLTVDVVDDTVIVSTPDGTNTTLMTHGPPLPRSDLQVAFTGTKNTEVVMGCPTSCPVYSYSSPATNKEMRVKQWSGDSVQFYFQPGDKFVRLEYEVACITTLGNRMFPQVADITLHRYQWHQVRLQHHSGLATVILDHRLLKNKTLPGACTFTEHTIKIVGDGLFSFTPKPFNGEVESMEEEGTSDRHTFMPLAIVGLIVAGIVLGMALSLVIFVKHRRKRQPQKKQLVQQQLQELDQKELQQLLQELEL